MNAYEMADKVDQKYVWLETKDLSNMLRRQADRIAEMEKYVGFKNSGYDIISANISKIKELNDEEIYEVWSTLPYDDQCPFDGRGIYNFARAILKKAGEK